MEAHLPPLWIDMQEDVEENIIQIRNMFNELRPLRNSRFGGMMFDDQGAQKIDNNISMLVQKITRTIQKSEATLKSMQAQDFLLTENRAGLKYISEVKKQIICNVQQKYLQQLAGFTR